MCCRKYNKGAIVISFVKHINSPTYIRKQQKYDHSTHGARAPNGSVYSKIPFPKFFSALPTPNQYKTCIKHKVLNNKITQKYFSTDLLTLFPFGTLQETNKQKVRGSISTHGARDYPKRLSHIFWSVADRQTTS